MKVKFLKLVDTAVTPSYAKPGDAGMDITAIAHKINTEHNFIEYHTGLAFEIPEGYVGLLFPRSSVSKKDLSLLKMLNLPIMIQNYHELQFEHFLNYYSP